VLFGGRYILEARQRSEQCRASAFYGGALRAAKAERVHGK